MAFKFQIHNDIQFQRNEQFLEKSRSLIPAPKRENFAGAGVVRLIEDPIKLERVGVEETNENLSSLLLGQDDTIILDFHDHRVGSFFIQAESVGSPMDAPLHIRLRFAEVAAELAHSSSEYDGWLSSSWIQEEFLHIDELPALITLPRRYSFRFVEIKVLDTSPKWKVRFTNPVVITENAVSTNDIPPLHLKDPELEAIWKVSVKTLADCMTDVFEDGPKRDRRLWMGDLRLQALSNYATFHNEDLVLRCLYLFGAMPASDGRISANVFVRPKEVADDTFLYDYSLFFISILSDYMNEYGRKTVLEDLYPAAKQQMDLALSFVKPEGFIELDENYPVFVDWSNEFNKEACAQAVTIYALRQFIDLTRQMNQDPAFYEQMLAQLLDYARTTLYDAEDGLFQTRDGEKNIASQVWMVLANVPVDCEQAKRVMENTLASLFPVRDIATPYMYSHITEALFKTGLTDAAVKLMKDYWGKMIELGADTFWEAFDPDRPDYSPYGNPIISSYCHAWSCTPAYLIQKYLVKKSI
ncbi:hypothetical protein AAK899_01715 [Erysipelotrichaceae bacterium 51-3]